MSKLIFQVLLVACLIPGTSRAANDPFVGKWKLNPPKSTVTDEMKVTSLGGNKYSFDFGGGTAEVIVVDGTDQPGVFGTTFAVTAVSPDEWRGVRKKDGRVQIKGIWKLSKDGNTLTDDFTSFDEKGTANNVIYVYKRTAGKSGFAGTWESSSEQLNSVFVLEVRPYEGDGLSFIEPDEARNVKFDGKDYPNQGTNAAQGSMTSGRRVNERTLGLTDKVNGQKTATEQVELSRDHKTLTMTVHVAGRSKPNVLVFERE